jgi:hypothetical protein
MPDLTAEIDEKRPIHVRTFKTPSEIWELPGFQHDNPVTKENYKDVLGDYKFGDEVRCCYMDEEDHLCRQAHKFGFVVILRDKSVSIIGNCCGRTKFDSEHKLQQDTARYLNRQKLLQAQARLAQLKDQKDQRLLEINELRRELSLMRRHLDNFSQQIGRFTLGEIQAREKTGRTEVEIYGVITKESTNETGKVEKERQRVPVRLGQLKGLQCFNRERYSEIGAKMKRVEDAFIQLEEDAIRTRRENQMNKLASEIDLSSQIVAEGRALLRYERAFFKGDLTLLCFLSSSLPDRIDTAVEILRENGQEISRSKARKWLSNLEQELKRSNRVEKIEL